MGTSLWNIVQEVCNTALRGSFRVCLLTDGTTRKLPRFLSQATALSDFICTRRRHEMIKTAPQNQGMRAADQLLLLEVA